MSKLEKENTVAEEKQNQEEMVSIHLFKDNERYKDDVFVAVNGRSFQIKRGETVTVPKCVADVLEQSLNQDAATAKLMDRESARFTQEAKQFGA